MVKTEAERRIIEPVNIKFKPPLEVIEALHRHDSALELVWNEDDNRWEFYRLKEKGPSREQDILHWQMSAPFDGSDIQPSIINWLRKYDTSEYGRKGPDRLKQEWILNVKDYIARPKELYKKRMEPMLHEWNSVFHRYAVGREQISVPIKIGRDTKKNKDIFAVKKQRRILNVTR